MLVPVESWKDFADVEISGLKWHGITINHYYYFRTLFIHDAFSFRENMTNKKK